MAGLNAFRDLKLIAKKEIKYKQNVHYGAIHKLSGTNNSFVLGEPVFDSTKNGFCTALSVEWLSEQLINGSPKNYARNEGKAWASDEKGLNNSASLMKLQHKIYTEAPPSTEPPKKSFLPKLFTFLQHFGIPPALGGSGIEDTLAGHMKEATGWANYAGMIILQDITHKDKWAGHTVALCHRNNLIHFFDPNIGGYEIKQDAIDKFCEKYIDLVTKTFDFKINEMIRYGAVDRNQQPKFSEFD